MRKLIACIVLTVTACGSPARLTDAGSVADAAAIDTGSSIDAPAPDSGGTIDAAAVDAAPFDAAPFDAAPFDAAAVDAAVTIDAPTTCDPIAQTGCAANQKCTWIVDLDGTATMQEIGHLGCVPNGTIADRGACVDASAAVNGGFDDCDAGDLCLFGVCNKICDPQAATGGGACPTNSTCSVFSGVLAMGAVNDGVCLADCEPLTQKLLAGPAPLDGCGSTDPTKPTRTCVPSQDFATYNCAPSGARVYGNTDRKQPLADGQGNPFRNGCAPGFIPFLFKDDSGSMQALCSGQCAPLDTDADRAAAKPGINAGDATALGKLITDPAPVAGHATCAAGIKGSDATGEDCRFIWFYTTPDGDPRMAAKTPYSDTEGLCFAFAQYVTDVDNDPTTPAVPNPSCATLPSPEKTKPSDLFGSAAANGCYSLTTALAAAAGQPARPQQRRRPTLRSPLPRQLLVRHAFN